MAEQESATQSRTEALLDRIEILEANDILRGESEHVERLGFPEKSIALPFSLVLSTAALRGEGFIVPPRAEERVVDTLQVRHEDWTHARLDSYSALGRERQEGCEWLSLALGEGALHALKQRQPLGYFALREMVKLAARQERALKSQAAIVQHNISVEAQL
jgi:hypothetical protein